MIRITKNGKTLEVTRGSFVNNFKDQGWVAVDGDSSNGVEAESSTSQNTEEPIISVEEPEVDEDSSEEEWDEVLAEEEDDEVEKPISEMSKKELIKKAESLGIEVSGNPTSNQLRDMIRETIN